MRFSLIFELIIQRAEEDQYYDVSLNVLDLIDVQDLKVIVGNFLILLRMVLKIIEIEECSLLDFILSVIKVTFFDGEVSTELERKHSLAEDVSDIWTDVVEMDGKFAESSDGSCSDLGGLKIDTVVDKSDELRGVGGVDSLPLDEVKHLDMKWNELAILDEFSQMQEASLFGLSNLSHDRLNGVNTGFLKFIASLGLKTV